MDVLDTQVALPVIGWVLWKQSLKEDFVGSLFETLIDPESEVLSFLQTPYAACLNRKPSKWYYNVQSDFTKIAYFGNPGRLNPCLTDYT